MKCILISTILMVLFCNCVFAQSTDSMLVNISIIKIIVKNSKRIVTIIKIDSTHNIFKNDDAVGKSIDAQNLSKVLRSTTDGIKIVKYPGDNDIKVIEYPFPQQKQAIYFIPLSV